jgi:hypothetical protein
MKFAPGHCGNVQFNTDASTSTRDAIRWGQSLQSLESIHWAASDEQSNEAPDDIYEEMRQRFTEQELVNLTMAIVVIDSWNRIAIGFMTVPNEAVRSQHRSTYAHSRKPLTVGGLRRAERAETLSTMAIHSSRSSIKGSTDRARCAGIHVASSPSNDIARTTPANTSGSRGVA